MCWRSRPERSATSGVRYCFFLDKEELYEGSRFHMSDEVLDRYIQQLIEAHSSPVVTVAWRDEPVPEVRRWRNTYR